MLVGSAISASVERLWKDRFDLLEDWEKTRERGESKDSRETRRSESARLILVATEEMDAWETCGTTSRQVVTTIIGICGSACSLAWPKP